MTIGEMYSSDLAKEIAWMEILVASYNRRKPRFTKASDFKIEEWPRERLMEEYFALREYCEDRFD